MSNVAFWHGMTKAQTVELLDKILLGRNADGKIHYADFNQLIGAISASVGSGIEPTAEPNTQLHAPEQAGKIMFMKGGNYTQPDGVTPLVAPDNSFNVAYWDGAAWSISISEEVEIDLADYVKKELLSEYTPAYSHSALTETGFVRPDGSLGTTTTYSRTGMLPIPEGVSRIRVNFNLQSTAASPLVFYDADEVYIEGVTIPVGGTNINDYPVPEGASFFRSSCAASYVDFGVDFYSLITDVASGRFVQDTVDDATTLTVKGFISPEMFTHKGFIRPDGTTGENAAYRYTEPVDVTGVTTLKLHTLTESGNVSPAVFLDAEGGYISGISGITGVPVDLSVDVPDGAKFVVSSIRSNYIGLFESEALQLIKFLKFNALTPTVSSGVCFIAPTGDDSNSGTSESEAVATLSRAKEVAGPDGELLFTAGDYIGLTLDLAAFAKVSGLGTVRILGGTHIAEADPVEGFSRVFSAAYASTIAPSSYLWQHDIEDEETVILSSKRHPFHRGRRVRVPSTRLYRASSISEIQATTDKVMWFQEDGVLYFSTVSGSVLSDNPVVIPSGTLVASARRSVKIQNLKFLYTSLLTTGLSGSFENIEVGMTNTNGAIRYDNTVGLTFKYCEAYGCRNDGWNGHTSAPTFTRTQVFFVDCYGHDNSDDGESCHEYCDITHWGGLYEYNGNGVTPASGGHATCYNVLVRNNGDHPWTTDKAGTGFSAQGPSIDGGIGTNIYCYSCVSENNTIGFRGLAEGGSRATSCISKNDATAYTNIDQLNCETL